MGVVYVVVVAGLLGVITRYARWASAAAVAAAAGEEPRGRVGWMLTGALLGAFFFAFGWWSGRMAWTLPLAVPCALLGLDAARRSPRALLVSGVVLQLVLAAAVPSFVPRYVDFDSPEHRRVRARAHAIASFDDRCRRGELSPDDCAAGYYGYYCRRGELGPEDCAR